MRIQRGDDVTLKLMRGGQNVAFLGDVGSSNDGGLILYDENGALDALIRTRDGQNSYLNTTGNFGFGTNSPVGKVEIIGSDGTVSGTPETDGDELVIRNNARAGLGIIAGEGSGVSSNVIFGSTSDINGANLSYTFNTKTMALRTQHASGILTLGSGNATTCLLYTSDAADE